MSGETEHRVDSGLKSWVVAFTLATFGLSIALISAKVTWTITLAWNLLSWAIVLMAEPVLTWELWHLFAHEPREPKAVESGQPESTSGIDEVPFLLSRRMLELGLIVVLAYLAFLSSRALHQAPNPPNHASTVKLSDEDKAVLRKCLDQTCNASTATVPVSTTIHLNAALEDALTRYLNNTNQPPTDGNSIIHGEQWSLLS